jgi:hypothetical protein
MEYICMVATQHLNRNTSIDALRGIAVTGMIAAHAIYFFHNGSSLVLLNIERILNLFTLTLFVFIAGISASLWIDKYEHIGSKQQRLRLFYHSISLYCGYILVVAFAVLTGKINFSTEEFLTRILESAIFISPPNFTEYFPLFIFFTLSLIPFGFIFKKVRTSIILTIIIGVISYFFGIILYPTNPPSSVNWMKEILAGKIGGLNFPILFYLPIYLFGLWWQYYSDIAFSLARFSWRKIIFVGFCLAITVSISLFSVFYNLPLLSLSIRWPPAIGFLTIGLTGAAILSITLTAISIPMWLTQFYRFIVYLGRDAYDLWFSHLILIFIYHRYIGFKSESVFVVILMFLTLLMVSAIISSITFTNTVTLNRFGPISFTAHESRRFRKKYILFAAMVGILLFWSYNQVPTGSAYGNIMTTTPLSVTRIPNDTQFNLSSDKTWVLRHSNSPESIILKLTINKSDSNIISKINPLNLHIFSGSTRLPGNFISLVDGSYEYYFNTTGLKPGSYPVTVVVKNDFSEIKSNQIIINITEPLIVAWTFDWEGWDASNATLNSIENISATFGEIPFTHFINPRTFLPGVISAERREIIKSFLQKRKSLGDELALHLHMQYDLVNAAGITPQKSVHWGLLPQEGYDVPATQYSPEEFRKILTFALNLTTQNGLLMPMGFRAGGWFINGPLLKVVSETGFVYDSSGRDRPQSGSFQNTPWQLPVGAQPYYPDWIDQNTPSASQTGLLEIPNNGDTTYDSSETDLKKRISDVYTSGILNKPKILVFVSHPQFAKLEFSKIPVILEILENISASKDKGPVIFRRVSDIYSIWTSLL